MIDYNFNTSGLFSFFYFINPNCTVLYSRYLYTFVYVTNGSCSIYFEDQHLTASEGQILFVPSEIEHKFVFTHPENELCQGIFFNVRFFAGVNPWDYAPQIINPNEELVTAIKNIPKNNDYKRLKKDCAFIRKAYTFLEMAQEYIVKRNNRFSKLIENAIDFMFNTPKYSISDIAKHCNISERYLSKLFEQTVGVPPIKMKQKIQAEKAEELLKSTNFTIDEIANMVGFDSTAHFRKIFESRFHTSPSKIRKLY